MRFYLWTLVVLLNNVSGDSSSAINHAAASNAASALLASISVRPVVTTVSGRPKDLASARASILAGNYTSLLHHQTRFQCPSSCSDTGLNASAWFTYGSGDLHHLKTCNGTILLDFALFNQVDDRESQVSISACAIGSDSFLGASTSKDSSSASCLPDEVQSIEVISTVDLVSSGESSSASTADVITALDQLAVYSRSSMSDCQEDIRYIVSGKAAIGVYIGSGLASQDVLTSVLEKLSAHVRSKGSISESFLAQLCSTSPSKYSLGVFVNTKSDLGSIQRGLQSWKNGSCVTNFDDTVTAWDNVT